MLRRSRHRLFLFGSYPPYDSYPIGFRFHTGYDTSSDFFLFIFLLLLLLLLCATPLCSVIVYHSTAI